MAEGGEKVRYAIGLFEDAPRLKKATDALVNVGIDPDHLCVAGHPMAVVDSNIGRWAGAESGSPAASSAGESTVFGILSGATFLWGAETPMTRALGRHTNTGPSLPGDLWATLRNHLATGVLLLIAQAPNTRLHDEAVRILLRHSHFPVHSEEFFRFG